ncbi:bifunctional DNA primase/polymerase [Lentzea tibetensis]|uniref:Bifunctional DNA primase/polymerase n=1 Tax=Lentzea tibetensis TaxID=2591470 RepID=A0A563EUR7_9PSEU|nr:bifunctional DNA primase/polymerase [Lentzea tibetensis]TWP51241.1 bifunctional DNA primase/polymerase [Lentzea tibetensis]
MPASTDLLTTALNLAARGWRVFPVRPGEKVTAIRQYEQRATTDPARIRRCWSAGPYNIGIAAGPSGLVVIDLDPAKPGEKPPPPWDQPGITCGLDVLAVLCEQAGQQLPLDTYTVTTPSGGLHLYFAAPDGVQLRNTAGSRGRGLGWRIDTRAWGGYVAAAGSVVDGRCYEVAENAPVLPLPGWLTDRLTPAPLPPREPVTVDLSGSRAGRYVTAAMHGEIAKVLAAEEGTRNHTLFAATVALGQLVAGGSLNADVAETALEQAGVAVGLSHWEVRNTIESGMKAGAERPRRVDAA